MRTNTRSHVVLELWDYFYIRNVPKRGDEKAWAAIERATCRMREAEIYLDAPTPPDVRLRNARRMRSAIRVASRQIDLLSVRPERWVIDGLAELEALSLHVIQETADEARELVLD